MAATLNNILNKGSESLENSRVGVDVAGHNISNAHTAGYSRQIVNIESKQPIRYGLHIFGDGAKVGSITRAHDKFVEGQLRREIQLQGRNETLSKGLQKLEGLFNPDLTSTVRDRFVSFSNAIRDFSNYPEEPATRINVIENGKALAQAFNASHAGINQVQIDANEEIRQDIGSLNEKLAEIASLNASIREMGAGGQTAVNDLEDKRDKLVKDVGQLVDVNVYNDQNDQITIRGPNECLLVEGRFSSRLQIENTFTPNSMPKIVVSEFDKDVFSDVTDKIKRGKIGALLEIRDTHAKNLRDTINTLAEKFGNEFNSIHSLGYGINDFQDKTGIEFFEGLGGPGEAAQDIHVNYSITANPNALAAAMSSSTPGDNVVANKLVKMFYEPYFDDKSTTVTGMYDKMIAKLGHQTVAVKEQAAASQIIFDKLKSQQEANSGVSLDEEAANLLKYQHLFNASSKIITTANEMFQTILELKR